MLLSSALNVVEGIAGMRQSLSAGQRLIALRQFSPRVDVLKTVDDAGKYHLEGKIVNKINGEVIDGISKVAARDVYAKTFISGENSVGEHGGGQGSYNRLIFEVACGWRRGGVQEITAVYDPTAGVVAKTRLDMGRVPPVGSGVETLGQGYGAAVRGNAKTARQESGLTRQESGLFGYLRDKAETMDTGFDAVSLIEQAVDLGKWIAESARREYEKRAQKIAG